MVKFCARMLTIAMARQGRCGSREAYIVREGLFRIAAVKTFTAMFLVVGRFGTAAAAILSLVLLTAT